MGGNINRGADHWELVKLQEEQIKKKNAENVRQLFEYLYKCDFNFVQGTIKQNPILVNLNSSEEHQSTLLISTLFMINNASRQASYTTNLTSQDKLTIKETINSLLNVVDMILQQDDFNIQKTDKDGNTALHRIFWYANITEDKELSKALAQRGYQLIARIQNSTMFRELLSQKNNYGETFLDNVFPSEKTTGHWTPNQKDNVTRIQEEMNAILEKFSIGKVGEAFNFNKDKFDDLLFKLLEDPVTLDIMESPSLLTTSGHTMGLDSWKMCNQTTKKHPLTNLPFKMEDLVPDTKMGAIIKIYNKYRDQLEQLTTQKNEALKSEVVEKLFQELHNHITTYPLSIEEKMFATNINLNQIYNLVEKYNEYKMSLDLPKDQQPSVKEQQPSVKEQQPSVKEQQPSVKAQHQHQHQHSIITNAPQTLFMHEPKPVPVLNKPAPIYNGTWDESKKWGLSMMLGATISCRLLPGGISENIAKQAKNLAFVELNEKGINIYFIDAQKDYSKNLCGALLASDSFKSDQAINLIDCNVKNQFGNYTTCLTIPGHNNVMSFMQNICGYEEGFIAELYRSRSDALLLSQVTKVVTDRITSEIRDSEAGKADTLILSWPDGKSITIDGADVRIPTTLAHIWQAIQTSNLAEIKKYISEAPLEVTSSRKQNTVGFYQSLQKIKNTIETNMSPPKPSNKFTL